jgi:hypothetical protein
LLFFFFCRILEPDVFPLATMEVSVSAEDLKARAAKTRTGLPT